MCGGWRLTGAPQGFSAAALAQHATAAAAAAALTAEALQRISAPAAANLAEPPGRAATAQKEEPDEI
ncbi:hypothetical protein EPH_0002050 [Eimeria praecox]|uniref:Uncharacterized protein n=1 Tax=Eimeria praecox TaxID=51316 RepID=U6G236_9EIME|nr:hypothetical protein EPH_0002050 [Eimeria praecox]